MKYSIIFSSRTGNTKLLAENLKSILPEKNCVYYGDVDEKALDSEMIFIGFGTYKGECDEKLSVLLNKLNNRKVFLFGTAGFGKSELYFEQILERVKKHINDSNVVVGTYMCQGKMPMTVRSRYESMLDKQPEKMKEMIENFDEALSHPNEYDFIRLNDKANKVYIDYAKLECSI